MSDDPRRAIIDLSTSGDENTTPPVSPGARWLPGQDPSTLRAVDVPDAAGHHYRHLVASVLAQGPVVDEAPQFPLRLQLALREAASSRANLAWFQVQLEKGSSERTSALMKRTIKRASVATKTAVNEIAHHKAKLGRHE